MAGYFPEELIEEIRISNDIVDVISEYVKLERKGKNYFGKCPFHNEKTASFSVEPTKQIYNCFGCGKAGKGYGDLPRRDYRQSRRCNLRPVCGRIDGVSVKENRGNHL